LTVLGLAREVVQRQLDHPQEVVTGQPVLVENFEHLKD
jgi:hypothetical protein